MRTHKSFAGHEMLTDVIECFVCGKVTKNPDNNGCLCIDRTCPGFYSHAYVDKEQAKKDRLEWAKEVVNSGYSGMMQVNIEAIIRKAGN